MRQVVRIIRKADFEKEKINSLNLETDYLLLTLHQAIQEGNKKEHKDCITRLTEIQDELKTLKL